MPKLSEDLPGYIRPDLCQSCSSGEDLEHWREHDERDRPTRDIVTLCRPCADRIVEPHPRLYDRIPRNAPIAGIMTLCRPCVFGSCNLCTSPEAKANGGPGIEIVGPHPITMFVDGTRNGRRAGWREVRYPGPPRACTGQRIPAAAPIREEDLPW